MNTEKFSPNILVSLFCVILVISNIASTKIIGIWDIIIDGGTLLFPISYIFGDIFAEVYGWKVSRRIILLGLYCILLNATILYLVQIIPAANIWENQESYEVILWLVPRITMGSIFWYLAWSFVNTWTLLVIRQITWIRWLWMRTIWSTIVWQLFDSTIFCLIAFYGTMPNASIVTIIVTNIIFKTLVETVMTPLTYKIIKSLKNHQ